MSCLFQDKPFQLRLQFFFDSQHSFRQSHVVNYHCHLDFFNNKGEKGCQFFYTQICRTHQIIEHQNVETKVKQFLPKIIDNCRAQLIKLRLCISRQKPCIYCNFSILIVNLNGLKIAFPVFVTYGNKKAKTQFIE